MSGCYDARATPGSGVCREARDGVCMMYREMAAQKRRPVDGGRHGAHDSMHRAERMRAVQCTMGNDGESTKCKNTKCDVWINSVQYCSQCAKTNEFLVNGVCKTTNEDSACATPSSPTDGTCKSCKAGYFLHEGGCYKVAESPGSFICSTQGEAGLCSACRNENGFFKNPSATAAIHQSCIACNRTAAVDNVKGVEGCTACSSPDSAGSQGAPKTTTCSACSNSKIVKTAKDKTTSCVTEEECASTAGFFVKGSGGSKACEACDSTCKTCSGAATQCTSCKEGNTPYLKKTDNSQTGTCVDANGCSSDNTYYADDAAKTCKSCAEGVSNCKTCTKESSGNTVTCSACLEGFFIETVAGSGTPSKKCTACADSNCAVCTTPGTGKCSECRDGYTLDSQANTCASSSANRSGLSTGAIAGISVAAVFVAASRARIGQVPRLLPSLDVRAISQARSPESNSDSPPGVGPSARCAVVLAPCWSRPARNQGVGSTVNTKW